MLQYITHSLIVFFPLPIQQQIHQGNIGKIRWVTFPGFLSPALPYLILVLTVVLFPFPLGTHSHLFRFEEGESRWPTGQASIGDRLWRCYRKLWECSMHIISLRPLACTHSCLETLWSSMSLSWLFPNYTSFLQCWASQKDWTIGGCDCVKVLPTSSVPKSAYSLGT